MVVEVFEVNKDKVLIIYGVVKLKEVGFLGVEIFFEVYELFFFGYWMLCEFCYLVFISGDEFCDVMD